MRFVQDMLPETHKALAHEKLMPASTVVYRALFRFKWSCVHDRRAVGAVRWCRSRQEDLLGQAATRTVLEVLHNLTSALGHHLAASAAPSPAQRLGVWHAQARDQKGAGASKVRCGGKSGKSVWRCAVALQHKCTTICSHAPHGDVDLVENLVRLIFHDFCKWQNNSPPRLLLSIWTGARD